MTTILCNVDIHDMLYDNVTPACMVQAEVQTWFFAGGLKSEERQKACTLREWSTPSLNDFKFPENLTGGSCLAGLFEM